MGSHYLPQKYLSGFEVDGRPGMIWMYDKKTRSSVCASIEKVAQERGYYSPEDEKLLAQQIEAPANPVLEKLRRREQISLEERHIFSRYIATFLTRVPRRRRRALELYPEVRERVLEEEKPVLEAWARSGADDSIVARRFEELDEIRAKYREGPPDAIVEQIRSPWPSEEMIRACDEMTWRIIGAKVDHMFITGDNPAFFFEGTGIKNSGSEITFPLSTNLALVANWQGPSGATYFVRPRPAYLKEINRRIVSGAERFIYSTRSAQWIATVADRTTPALNRLLW